MTTRYYLQDTENGELYGAYKQDDSFSIVSGETIEDLLDQVQEEEENCSGFGPENIGPNGTVVINVDEYDEEDYEEDEERDTVEHIYKIVKYEEVNLTSEDHAEITKWAKTTA